MTTESLAKMFERPHKEGNGYRCRCPVHKSTGLTLAIYPKAEKSAVICFAGCSSDDVLAAVGLTWRDTYYTQRIATPETRRRAFLLGQLEVRERRLGLMDMLEATMPEKRNYWRVAIESTEQEIIWIRREVYPNELLPRRYRGTRLEKR